MTTSTGSSSAITSHACSSSRAGRCARRRLERLRRQRRGQDALDLERPARLARLVPADQVQRVGQRRRLDRQRPHARLAWPLGRVVDARVVLDLDHAPLGPRLGQDAEDAREALVGRRRRERVDRAPGCARRARAAGSGPASRTRRSARCRARRSSWPASARRGTASSPRAGSAPAAAGRRSPSSPNLPLSFQIGSPASRVHRLDVAVDGALGHADSVGQRLGRDAVRVIAQDHRDLADSARRDPTLPSRGRGTGPSPHGSIGRLMTDHHRCARSPRPPRRASRATRAGRSSACSPIGERAIHRPPSAAA